ncbi:Fis family transcriptional regulator [Candidatus Nitromaritima sp. SCGC AAA799-A02]|nr:Fis family transcriptional regulator [Candidatus Nitromaritima sp. SCGC AAA799-A02]KMP12005.1 Fis family transcriptional regulator [Candidatus Nitromaritima sp. SCGC AAA799-C22]
MAIKKIVQGEAGFPVKVWTDDLDAQAEDQLLNLSSMPFIHQHVAVMPDAHIGLGCTIGCVVPTVKAIIPAAVGVDIGCGMMAARTNLYAKDLPDDLSRVRNSIERTIPLGPGKCHHNEPDALFAGIENQFVSPGDVIRFLKDDPEGRFGVKAGKWRSQLGTLGGGNHFIETCLDEADRVWVMLHSGSRGVGNRIGMTFIQKAKEDMRIHHVNLPDRDLSYFSEGTSNFDDYVKAVGWAQEYASLNRRMMMTLIFGQLEHYFPQVRVEEKVINCHHNYVEQESHFGETVWVTRKGAIRARENDMGIIPGSMGAKSYIVSGKGNPESFHSCSHGAGRRMSRKQAFKKFSMEDLEAQTEGVEMTRRKAIIDEIPQAYKDIDQVMGNQEDLVTIVHTLKQILNVKGD